MTKTGATAAILGAALMLAACSQGDDGSPTAEENAQLNDAANMLDTTDASADSLVAQDAALGNGESADTGDVLVADEGNGAATNSQ